MSKGATSQGRLRWDRLRAGLGIAAALAAVAAKLAGKAGVVTVGAVTLLQLLNSRLWRSHSASLDGGRERHALQPGSPSGRTVVKRAELVFLLEELAGLGTALWWLVLVCWAVGIPVHPLMYAVMLLLVCVVLLQQLFPQLRGFRPRAARRVIVRPPPSSLH